MFAMPGQSYQGQLPPLTAAERTIRNHSRDIVQHLAGTIGDQNRWCQWYPLLCGNWDYETAQCL